MLSRDQIGNFFRDGEGGGFYEVAVLGDLIGGQGAALEGGDEEEMAVG